MLDLVQGQAESFAYLGAAQGSVEHDGQFGVGELAFGVPGAAHQPFGGGAPGLAHLDLPDDASIDAITRGQNNGVLVAGKDGGSLLARELGAGTVFHDREGAVPLGVRDVVGLGAIGEVAQPVIKWVPVQVPDLDALRLRAEKGMGNELVDVDVRGPWDGRTGKPAGSSSCGQS